MKPIPCLYQRIHDLAATQAKAELSLTVPPTVHALNTWVLSLVKAGDTCNERPLLFYDHALMELWGGRNWEGLM